MIQRKQTLFLLAVCIIAILMFFISFQVVKANDTIFPVNLLTSFKTPSITSNIFFPLILNMFITLLSILTIFIYKKRILQFKLSNLLVLLNMILMGSFFLLSFVNGSQQGAINYEFGAFLPIISATFAFLAAHFIKKDEQLVRNADRIR